MRDLRVITQILVKQKPSTAFPGRTNTLFFDFCEGFEAEDSWESLTNDAKISWPKKITVLGDFNKPVSLGNSNFNIGGFNTTPPAFLRGDEIVVRVGYRYRESNIDKLNISTCFQGYVAKVGSKIPFELMLEDNMFILKQLPAPNKVFKATHYTLESMLRELLHGTKYTVNALTQTSLGDFTTRNETVADVLARLRKDYHFFSYFRGDELRCGAKIYIDSEAKSYNFDFQENIFSDELEYQRKDDIVLSALAYSVNKTTVNTVTKDGNPKTKQVRLEALVTFQNGKFTAKINPPGQKADFPPNYTGERRTLFFWNVNDSKILVQLAQQELLKYYYNGLKGSFTTLGIPFVRQGDNAILTDNILPERSGTYRIKSVKYKFSVERALEQTIELDYKIA